MNNRKYKDLRNHPSLAPYKGYFQEVQAYSIFPFHPHRDTLCNFIILSQHRSGSSLLVNLLDSLPSIHCEGELLYYRKMYPLRYIECRRRMSSKSAFGFKLMINHIGYQGYSDAKQFVSNINKSGYAIIKLSRRNLFRSAISLLYAQETRKFHYDNSKEIQVLPKITLEPPLFIRKYLWLQQLADLLNQSTVTIPHLGLVYEDHLQNPEHHQTTIDLVTDFLDLPHADAHTSITRMPTEDYSEYINNLDEILLELHKMDATEFVD